MPRGNKNIKKYGKRFSSEYQPNKRRGKSVLTEIKKQLHQEDNFIILKDVELFDKNNNPIDRDLTVKVKCTNIEALAQHYINRAYENDTILKHLIELDAIGVFEKPTEFGTFNGRFTDEEKFHLRKMMQKLIVKD